MVVQKGSHVETGSPLIVPGIRRGLYGYLTNPVQAGHRVGFAGFFAAGGWKNLIMIPWPACCSNLGIGKKFEPLLAGGHRFRVLLTNIPGAGLYHMGMWDAYVYECPYDAVNDYAL